MVNGYPNGLSMAIQIVYQPQSKWIINYFLSESSTFIQVDYQLQSSGKLTSIQMVYERLSK